MPFVASGPWSESPDYIKWTLSKLRYHLCLVDLAVF